MGNVWDDVLPEEDRLVFEAAGTSLRIQKVEHLTPQPFTALGFSVPDIQRAIIRGNGPTWFALKGRLGAKCGSVPRRGLIHRPLSYAVSRLSIMCR